MYIIWPLTSSLSDRDHSTFDFGPGLEYTKVLIISSIILLLGTAILHFLIEYLKTVETPHTGADTLDKLQSDFKKFYTQYDTRRGKSFEKTFSNELVTWYEQI